MPDYLVRSRLPVRYNTAIGRMVTRFSVLEARLRRVVYGLLNVSAKLGRVAVRSPRVEDAFTMIEDLMAIRQFTTTVPLRGEDGLISGCRQLERFRDQVAHGVWVKHPGSKEPVLQITAGNFSPPPGERGKVKARISPQAFEVSMEAFRAYAKSTTKALKMTDKLTKELEKQHRAWLRRRSQQSKPGQSRKSPRGRQNPAKPQSQPKS